MALITVVLQNLQFPDKPEFATCEELFFREGLSQELPQDRLIYDDHRWDFSIANGVIAEDRRPSLCKRAEGGSSGSGARYDAVEGCLIIPAGHIIDLSCYLNMISVNKWLTLTNIENIVLSLDFVGDVIVDIVSYSLPGFKSGKQVNRFAERRFNAQPEDSLLHAPITSASYSFSARETSLIPIGHPDATLVGIVITAKTETRVYGGAWLGSVESEYVRNVELCIATTTFQKEEFITRNVETMKAALKEDADLAAHFQMIVVDNGRTLNPADYEDEHVHLFGNMNAGGSGGFARGMIEALRLEKRPTHLLIMDDDVFILPESIRRTYTLLTLLRSEYQKHYISGAMLRTEAMDVQHEDIGFIHERGFYASKKGAHSLRTILDCAYNETDWPDFGREYAAWWYCCVPMEFVTEQTLPVPFFIRGDDVEYSIRNNAGVIAMNGICVWHVGFSQKFNANMEYYQVIRNSFIIHALHPTGCNTNFLRHCDVVITQLFNRFSYDYADLILDAIEDFLKGPSIIEKPNGIEVIKEKGRKNEQLVPLADVWLGSVDLAPLFDHKKMQRPLSVARRKMVTASCNGQLMMRSRVTDDTGFASYDWEYAHEPVFFKKQVVCINPNDCTAIMHVRNPKRFAEVFQRKAELFERYNKEHEQVEQAYRDAYPRLTSLKFWAEYLELDSTE